MMTENEFLLDRDTKFGNKKFISLVYLEKVGGEDGGIEGKITMVNKSVKNNTRSRIK